MQACNEICTMADMDEIDRTFEERRSEELAVIGKLQSMGVDVFSFTDDLPPELSQKCLDLIVDQKFEGTFEELKARAEVELGKTFPEARVNPYVPEKENRHKSQERTGRRPDQARNHEKPDQRQDKGGKRPEDIRKPDDRKRETVQPNIRPDRLAAIAKNFNGEIPQAVLDKLNNPNRFISDKDWNELPGIVKGTLIELRKNRPSPKTKEDHARPEAQANVERSPYQGDVQVVAELIAKHSFEKHRLGATFKYESDGVTKEDLGPHGLFNEFPGDDLRTVSQMKQEIERIISNPTESKKLGGDREAYYDEKHDAVVVINLRNPEKSTFFQPAKPNKDGGVIFGKQYFDEELR